MPRVVKLDGETNELAPPQCSPKAFAGLLRQQGTLAPHYLRLSWYVCVVLIFIATSFTETANRGEQQTVLEATKTAIETAVWDAPTQSVLADVQAEADIYTWLATALLPLLQSSEQHWYSSTAYKIVDADAYRQALDRKPSKDKAPDAGYPLWDARLGQYVLTAGMSVRKFNSAIALRLMQTRGERKPCDMTEYIDPKVQTELLGGCFLPAAGTQVTPSWDDVFKRGLEQEIGAIQFRRKRGSSLVDKASAMEAFYKKATIEHYSAHQYGVGNCVDPANSTAERALPARPPDFSCRAPAATGSSQAPLPPAECDAKWKLEWLETYTPTQRLFYPNRTESAELATARSACYNLTKQLLDASVMRYFSLQSNNDADALKQKQAGDAKVGLVFLSMLGEMADNVAVVELLRKHSWIDVATRQLRLTVPLFNANHQLFIVANVVFDFDTGGNLKTTSTFRVVNMVVTTNSTLSTLCVAIVVLMAINELVSILLAIARDLRQPMRPHIHVWAYLCVDNFIDWFVIVLGSMTAQAYTTSNHFRTGFRFPDSLDPVANPGKIAQSINELSVMADLNQEFNSRMGLLLLVLCFKAYSALSFHPRFGILCEQLKRSAPDIGYFLVMFSFFFLGYALLAHYLFGTHLGAYSTVERAIISSFNILLGSFDVQELTEVGVGWWAYGFFYSYNVLLLWILLNVFIAICSDAYQQVKEESRQSSSTFHTSRMIFLGRKKLNSLADCFDLLGDELVTPARITEELEAQGVGSRMISRALIAISNVSPRSSRGVVSRASVAAELASTRCQLAQVLELQKDMAQKMGIRIEVPPAAAAAVSGKGNARKAKKVVL
jgi:hypothetical protein